MNKWLKPINQQLINAKLSSWGWWLLGLILTTLSFGQLQRVTLSPTISFYAHDVLICLWLIIHWRLLFNHFKNIIWKKYSLELFFGAWVMLGMVMAPTDIVPWLYLSRLIAYSTFLVSLWLVFSKSSLALRLLAASLGLVFMWYGLLQYLLFPDLRFLFSAGWDDHYYRLAGTILDPNFFGMIATLAFIYLYSLKKMLPIKIWLGLLALCIITITLTYSRASYLSLLMAMGLIWLFPEGVNSSLKIWKSSSRKLLISSFKYLLAAVGIAICTYLLAPKPGGEGVNLARTASIVARQESNQLALSQIDSINLVLGKGIYSWQIIHTSDPTNVPMHARVPDNLFIHVTAATGLVGLILFLLIAGKYLPKLAKTDWLLFVALMAVVVHGQFNNTLLEPFVYLFLGLGFASSNMGRKNIIRL